MYGDTLERAVERIAGLIEAASPKLHRPDGVPRIRAALPGVKVAAPFKGQFALELPERASLVSGVQIEKAQQPVKRHPAEA